ncbi:MAG: DUF4367 domain-containing protein [Clostridia bacterium]|nr:DUF4367 domain-containing protein [Clostridia bacterium]
MNNFEKACEMSLNDWLATIPEIVPEAEYTKNHEKWKRKLFNKMRDNRYHRFTTKTVKVLMIAAVLSALLLTAFVIPSSREYIIDNFDIFSRYQLTESNDNSVNGEITVGYIPEGFEKINEYVSSKNIFLDYENSSGTIINIIKSSSANKVEFDTEAGIIDNIIINDTTYTFYDDETDYNCIVWNKNDYVYQIHSTVSKGELLKIAETVK